MNETYTIGYSPRNIGSVDEAQIKGAIKALKAVAKFKRSDETVQYIKAPNGQPISEWELEQEARAEEPY